MSTPRRASGKSGKATPTPKSPAKAADKPAKPAKAAKAAPAAGKTAGKPEVKAEDKTAQPAAARVAKKVAQKVAQKVAKKVAQAARVVSAIVTKKKVATKNPVGRDAPASKRTRKGTGTNGPPGADKNGPGNLPARTSPKETASKTASAPRAAKKVGHVPEKALGKTATTSSRAKSPRALPKAGKAAQAGKPAKTDKTNKAAKTDKAALIPADTPKTTRKARRPTSFTPRDVERSYGFSPETPELPAAYGEDRLVLMTRDPETLFAYWEITPARKREAEKAMRRGEQYQEALRINWPARTIFENNFVIFPVTFTSRKWYVRVPFAGLSYHADIGWLGDRGHFVPMITSNLSDTPESWDATQRRLQGSRTGQSLLRRALRQGAPQGSSEQTPDAREDILAAFQGPGSQGSSSGTRKASAKPARRAAG